MTWLDVTPSVELSPVPRVVLTVADSVLDNDAAPVPLGAVDLPDFPGSTVDGMQSHGWDSVSGDLYVAQNESTVSDDLVIYRCTLVDGVYTPQDHAVLTHGGHGNTIAVENDNGDVYIWNFWRGLNPGPTRYLYGGTAAGVTVAKSDSSVETLPDMDSGVAVSYSIDATSGTVALWRGSGGAGWERVTLRNLDEFKAGTDNPIGVVQYTPGTGNANSFAGFQIADDYLYVYRGGAYNVGHPYLQRFSWTDPTSTPLRLDLQALGAVSYGPGVFGLNEAEGVSLQRDTDGNAVITVGVMTAPVSGSRDNALWSLVADDIPAMVQGVQASGVQRINADGTVEQVRSQRAVNSDARGVWYDYEASQQEQVTYQAIAPQSATAPPVSAGVVLPDVGAWLIDPTNPAGSVPLTVQQDGFTGWTRASSVSVVPIAGRATPHVVESSVRQDPTGDLAVWVSDRDVHSALMAVLDSPGPKLISLPKRFYDGLVSWCVISSWQGKSQTPAFVFWDGTLSLQPCIRPAVVAMSSARTWADLRGTTWADLSGTRWADL